MKHNFEFDVRFTQDVMELLQRYGYDDSFGAMLTPLAITVAIFARSLFHQEMISQVDADRLPEWFHQRLKVALQTVKSLEQKR